MKRIFILTELAELRLSVQFVRKSCEKMMSEIRMNRTWVRFEFELDSF